MLPKKVVSLIAVAVCAGIVIPVAGLCLARAKKDSSPSPSPSSAPSVPVKAAALSSGQPSQPHSTPAPASAAASSVAVPSADNVRAASGTSAAGNGPASAPPRAGAANQAASDAENARHRQALDAIGAQYDPQIAALQNSIAKYLLEGADQYSDKALAAQQQKVIDDKNLLEWLANGDYYSGQYEIAENAYNNDRNTLFHLEWLEQENQKMAADVRSLTSLQNQEQADIARENALHTVNLGNLR